MIITGMATESESPNTSAIALAPSETGRSLESSLLIEVQISIYLTTDLKLSVSGPEFYRESLQRIHDHRIKRELHALPLSTPLLAKIPARRGGSAGRVLKRKGMEERRQRAIRHYIVYHK